MGSFDNTYITPRDEGLFGQAKNLKHGKYRLRPAFHDIVTDDQQETTGKILRTDLQVLEVKQPQDNPNIINQGGTPLLRQLFHTQRPLLRLWTSLSSDSAISRA